MRNTLDRKGVPAWKVVVLLALGIELLFIVAQLPDGIRRIEARANAAVQK